MNTAYRDILINCATKTDSSASNVGYYNKINSCENHSRYVFADSYTVMIYVTGILGMN